jgi:hypothetical protein
MAQSAGGPARQLEVYETFLSEVTAMVERFRIDVEDCETGDSAKPEVLFEV